MDHNQTCSTLIKFESLCVCCYKWTGWRMNETEWRSEPTDIYLITKKKKSLTWLCKTYIKKEKLVFRSILLSFSWINLDYISNSILYDLNRVTQYELNESTDEPLTYSNSDDLNESCFYGLILSDLIVKVHSWTYMLVNHCLVFCKMC